jgi:asparagine synthase (glutamine-hydrolysing)
MSVQWGLWEFECGSRREAFLAAVPPCLQQWGPDGYGCFEADQLCIGAQSFHVTPEDLRQEQPFVREESKNAFTFDGRLDNRAELLLELDVHRTQQATVQQGAWNPSDICEPGIAYLADRGTITPDSKLRQAQWLVTGSDEPTDLEIAAAAFEEWNTGCFARLRGDWAMVVWEKAADLIHLSRDPFGSRHLFYTVTKEYLCWSSRYEPLGKLGANAQFRNGPLAKDPVYAVSSVLALPALDATPYRQIRAVPPAHVVSINRSGKARIKKVAPPPQFRPDQTISFKETRETLRHLLERSLTNRMRSAFPITIELSGGCDSSTLVCLADHLYREGKILAEWKTVTRWPFKSGKSQDYQYARIVEESVGRRGRHVCMFNVDESEETVPASAEERAASDAASNSLLEHSPSLIMRTLWNYRAHYTDVITENGGRVLICGTGGDELAGGVQDAAVGLSEEWVGRSLSSRIKSLASWALYKNETVWRLLIQVASENLPVGLMALLHGPTRRQARVMRRRFPEFSTWRLAMIRFAFSGSAKPLRSRRQQANSIWPLSAELSHRQRLCHIGSWHRAFPFISQDWVEALAVLPPEYLQAPFQRRRLLREAFADIVPSPVLWRKTKDFGTFTARSSGKTGETRLLKDLEEHAQVLQLLKASPQLTSASLEPDPVPVKAFAQINCEVSEVDASDNFQYQPAAHIRFVAESSGATLLDINRGKRVVLNSTAAFIWQGIADNKSRAQISRELANNFQISHPDALSDTREFIGNLMRNKMLVFASGEASMSDLNSRQEKTV